MSISISNLTRRFGDVFAGLEAASTGRSVIGDVADTDIALTTRLRAKGPGTPPRLVVLGPVKGAYAPGDVVGVSIARHDIRQTKAA